MAITSANLTSGQDTDGNSTAAVSSITTHANKLALLAVTCRTNITVDSNTPTITDSNRTWTQVGNILWDTTSASRKRVTLFRCLSGSDVTGSATIDYGGQNQTNIIHAINEFDGVDTSGTNGSGAIVQAVTNKDETATNTSFTVTLAAFGNVNNATYGAIAQDNISTTLVIGSGFTQMYNVNDAANINLLTEFKASNDTTVDASQSQAAMFGGIAVEIKAAAGVVANTGFFGFM
jgi:hypothetical protein